MTPASQRRGPRLLHLGADLRRVRRARAEHDLQVRVDLGDRVDEMDDALLARDAADEQHERPVRVDAVADQDVAILRRPVLGRVDAVMDDVDPLGLDVEQPQHVISRFAGDGDDCVRLLDRGALHPGAEVIGVAELLDLPRP